jgi:hypothetical protein
MEGLVIRSGLVVLIGILGLGGTSGLLFADEAGSAEGDKILDSLKARGYVGCHPTSYVGECQVPSDYRPTAQQIKERDDVLASYSGYSGGTEPVGTFGAIGLFGEDVYDRYSLKAGPGKVEIYPAPDPKSKPTLVDTSHAPEVFSTAYKQYDFVFSDAKPGFIKIKVALVDAKSKAVTWVEGWIKTDKVSWARGFDGIANRISELDPAKLDSLYDAPNGKKVPAGPAIPNRTSSISAAKTMIKDGRIWIKIGHQEGNPCADGTEETPKEWVDKWIPYPNPAIVFAAPEGC